MALAPFFSRIFSAVGKHVGVSRESLSKALGGTRVGVTCAEHPSQNERAIAEMSVNLAARLYPFLAINTPNEELRKQLINLAESINPRIEVSAGSPPEFTVGIGAIAGDRAVHAASSGWVAEVTTGKMPSEGPTNPYSSAAAAALAWSEIFRRVFLHQYSDQDVRVSLLDYGETTGRDLELSELSVGEVLFVGVGAVGNAAIWAMSRDLATSGHLTLIDHETLSLSNLQRYVLGTMSDIEQPKVNLAAKILGGSRLETRVSQLTLEEHGTAAKNCPTICISLDNIEGRRAAQALLPRLIVNGWTGEGSLGASWHEFDNGQACLACLYHPHGEGLSIVQQAARAFGLSEERAIQLWLTRAPLDGEERRRAAKKLGVHASVLAPWRKRPIGDLYTDIVCGAVPIDLPGVKNVEVVPLAHQSVLAGVMMAAELLKRTNKSLSTLSQREPLVAWEDVLRKPPQQWRRPRGRERGCICGDAVYQEVYRAKWRNISL